MKYLALTYRAHGSPYSVLEHTELQIPKLLNNQVLLKLVAAPVNPSDINQIQGTYPLKPIFQNNPLVNNPFAIGGNEGVFKIVEMCAPTIDCNFKLGDWVIPADVNMGTWREYMVAEAKDLIRIPNDKISKEQAAMISVNASTAYRMLKDFISLSPGDVVIQNCATSGVGKNVIQLSKIWGFKTMNVIRDRANDEEYENVANELNFMGADAVIKESTGIRERMEILSNLTNGLNTCKLGLNGVGGKSGLNISRMLSDNGVFVTYGGMSRESVQVPTGMLIFKDITCKGYWMSRWIKKNPREERLKMLDELIEYMHAGNLKSGKVEKTQLKMGLLKETKEKQMFM